MGLFEKVFGKHPPVGYADAQNYFKTFTAYSPSFRNWNGAIYESELVRASVEARARHISKLDFEMQGPAKAGLRSKLKIAPNEFQTWGQFFARVSTVLDVENTAFIVPQLDAFGEINGLLVARPAQCDVTEKDGIQYLRFTFSTGEKGSMELSKVGIMTRMQYKDDFFGDSNNALRPTMELIDVQNQGIKEAVKAGGTFRFLAQMNNFAKADDVKKEREAFNEKQLKEGGGLLLFPNTYSNIQQIKPTSFTVDADQRKLIEKNVNDYFGTNDKIIQNSANDEELDAFFNGSIEPFAIQLSDVLTKMLYSYAERIRGNRVYITANRLQYMSVVHKISMATQLGDRGMITIDEVRDLFNYAPLPNGAGQKAPIRGEYYFAGENKDGGDSNAE